MILGTSVGAVNGAVIAADPSAAGVARLADLWRSMTDAGIFADTMLARTATLARHRTHLYSAAPFRRQLREHLPRTFAELRVPFQCVPASIELAGAHWFSSGDLPDAVLASSAVPGLLPPVHIGDEHFLDGGLVHSIPVGRALALGAKEMRGRSRVADRIAPAAGGPNGQLAKPATHGEHRLPCSGLRCQ